MQRFGEWHWLSSNLTLYFVQLTFEQLLSSIEASTAIHKGTGPGEGWPERQAWQGHMLVHRTRTAAASCPRRGRPWLRAQPSIARGLGGRGEEVDGRKKAVDGGR